MDALKSGQTDAIFVDMYLPSKRSDLFNGTWFQVAQFVEVDISHGIVLRGEAMKMHKALEDFITQNNVQSNYLSSGDKVGGLMTFSVSICIKMCLHNSFFRLGPLYLLLKIHVEC